MPRITGGDKRSSWLTFQRRLFVLRRLIRGPATATTLINDARATFDSDIFPPDASAALRHDLAKLRGEFGCVITLRDGRYVLDSPGQLAVLDVPEQALEALAFLLATFENDALPNGPAVQQLLMRVTSLLPSDRRVDLERVRVLPRLDHPETLRSADQYTLDVLRQALERQQVRFVYRSSYVEQGESVTHTVAPYDVLFRDGHTYLDAFCLDCGVPEHAHRYRLYRLDRIVPGSMQLLPTRLPPGQPPRRVYRLRYWLNTQVARQQDIALWFPESSVDFSANGALVTAYVSDLWQARQLLLRYREHCHVIEPTELISMIRESLTKMQHVYNDGEVRLGNSV